MNEVLIHIGVMGVFMTPVYIMLGANTIAIADIRKQLIQNQLEIAKLYRRLNDD